MKVEPSRPIPKTDHFYENCWCNPRTKYVPPRQTRREEKTMGNNSSNGYGDTADSSSPGQATPQELAEREKNQEEAMTDYEQMRSALAEALDIEDTGQPWTLLVEQVWAMRQRLAAPEGSSS